MTFNEEMAEYRKQLEKGSIQKAYRGLMDFMQQLRSYFNTRHPVYSVPGSLYFGYMDMTYFAIIPEGFKERGLKIAVVFLHDAFRFEVWLSGYNRQIQARYWKVIKESGWDKYHLVSAPQGFDSVLEHILVAEPDFDDLEELTARIEKGTLEFIRDVEDFLKTVKA